MCIYVWVFWKVCAAHESCSDKDRFPLIFLCRTWLALDKIADKRNKCKSRPVLKHLKASVFQCVPLPPEMIYVKLPTKRSMHLVWLV